MYWILLIISSLFIGIGDSAAESQNEEECIELYNPESLVVHPNDDNKIVCRVEKPKINSTLFMEYEDAYTEQHYSRILTRLEVEMHINFPPLGEWTKVRCCYGYGEDLDYCRGIWFFVNKKNNRKLKKECVIVEFPTVAVTKVYRTNEKYCNISVTPTEVALGDAVSAICQSREEYSGLHWDVVQWTGRGKQFNDFKSSMFVSNTSKTTQLNFKLRYVPGINETYIFCKQESYICGFVSFSLGTKHEEYTRTNESDKNHCLISEQDVNLDDKWTTKAIGMRSGVAMASSILIISLALYCGAKCFRKRKQIQKSSLKADVRVTKESNYTDHPYECIDYTLLHHTPQRGEEEEEPEPQYEEIPYVRNVLQPVVNNKVDEYVTVHPDPTDKQVVVNGNLQASLKNKINHVVHDQSYLNSLNQEKNKETQINDVRKESNNVTSRISCNKEFRDQNRGNKEFIVDECKNIKSMEQGHRNEDGKGSDKAIVSKDCGNDIYLDMTPKR